MGRGQVTDNLVCLALYKCTKYNVTLHVGYVLTNCFIVLLFYLLHLPLTHAAIDDVLEVTNYLLGLTQTDIHNLGLTLGLNHSHLKNMASSETFRDDMIAAWLQKEDQVTKRGVPTWKMLVKALRDRRVNQTGVADKIETENNC